MAGGRFCLLWVAAVFTGGHSENSKTLSLGTDTVAVLSTLAWPAPCPVCLHFSFPWASLRGVRMHPISSVFSL